MGGKPVQAGPPLPVLKFKAAELAAKISKATSNPGEREPDEEAYSVSMAGNGSEAPRSVIGHMKKMEKKHFILEN
jgi:hypothetical protein